MEAVVERDVVFGRMPLDGWRGLIGEHWALKVGETWHEVGAVPDSQDGHINARSAKVGPAKIDIVGQYDIVKIEGDKAASGAEPASVAYSPTSFLWLQVMAGVGYVTFFIFYFLVVPKPNLTTIERVIFLLLALVASQLVYLPG